MTLSRSIDDHHRRRRSVSSERSPADANVTFTLNRSVTDDLCQGGAQ